MSDLEPNSQLQEEVRTLRAAVESLQRALASRYQVTLRALQSRPFLGQPVTVVVTVLDMMGVQPRADAPVTLVTTWGMLQGANETGALQGSAVTLRTGLDGTARVTLLPPTSEDLTFPQQAALETLLDGLNPDAVTPQDDLAAFQNLVQHYLWEANFQFRDAVDIYFRDFRPKLLDTVNTPDWMAGWSYFDSAVLAYAGDEEQGDELNTFVAGSAALPLRFKDWLSPWLQTYLNTQQNDKTLATNLGQTTTLYTDPNAMLNDITGRLHDFVSRQRGRVGEFAGRKAAETSVEQLLHTGIQNLSDTMKIALFPSVQAANDTVVTTGPKLLSALGQTRTDVQETVTTKVAEVNTQLTKLDTEKITPLTANLGQLQTRVDTKLDVQDFTGFRDQIGVQLNTKLNATEFTAFQGQIGTQLAGKLNSADFTTFQNQISTQLNNKLNTATFTAFQGQVNTQLGTKLNATDFTAFQSQINSRVDSKVDATAFTAFQGDVAGKISNLVDRQTFASALDKKVESQDFATFRTQINTDIGKKADANEFTRFQDEVRSKLNTKLDVTKLTDFQTSVERTLATKVDAATVDAAISRRLQIFHPILQNLEETPAPSAPVRRKRKRQEGTDESA